MRHSSASLALILVSLVAITARAQTTFVDQILYTVPTGSAQFGDRIERGDVDGDGVLDLAIADTAYDMKGRVWIFKGPDYNVPLPVFIPNSQPWDYAGYCSGFDLVDVDADGLDDLIFGARTSKSGGTITAKGRAFVSYAPSFQTTIELQHPAPETPWGTYFGELMVAYDHTGDGIVDLLVGSPGWGVVVTPTTTIPGRIDVYSGATGFLGPPITTYSPAVGPGGEVGFGWTLLLADYDGNGTMDILTSDGDANTQVGAGFSWFLDGSPDNLFTFGNYPFSIASPYHNVRYEDVTGDGHRDIVSSSLSYPGSVRLVRGPTFTSATQFLPANGYEFGRGQDIGDVNRDGVGDLVIGDPEYEDGVNTALGLVTIYYGPDFNLTQTYYGAHAHAEFGTGIHVHDFDGNGFEEILIGAGGEYGGSLHRYRHPTLRAAGATSISLTSGGSAPLAIDVGALSGFKPYLVLASTSGSAPGVDVPYLGGALHLPLNFDAFTWLALGFLNTPFFANFQGTTAGKGKATATFSVPPNIANPTFAGIGITFAAVVAGASGSIAYTTDAVTIQLTP